MGIGSKTDPTLFFFALSLSSSDALQLPLVWTPC